MPSEGINEGECEDLALSSCGQEMAVGVQSSGVPARRWAAAAWHACWRPAEMKSGGSGGGGALYSTRGGGAGSWRAEKSDGGDGGALFQ